MILLFFASVVWLVLSCMKLSSLFVPLSFPCGACSDPILPGIMARLASNKELGLVRCGFSGCSYKHHRLLLPSSSRSSGPWMVSVVRATAAWQPTGQVRGDCLPAAARFTHFPPPLEAYRHNQEHQKDAQLCTACGRLQGESLPAMYPTVHSFIHPPVLIALLVMCMMGDGTCEWVRLTAATAAACDDASMMNGT